MLAQTTQNLEAHFTFDSTLLDVSGNNHHLEEITPYISNFIADRNGSANNAIYFSGNGGLKTILPFVNGSFTEQTVSFWMKTNSYQTYRQAIVQGAYAGFGGFINGYSTNMIAFMDGSGAGAYNVPNIASDNNWHHIAFTSDGTVTKVYWDGQYSGLNYEPLVTSSNYSNTSNIYVGRANLTNTNNYTGAVDDLRIYSKVLTSGEIGQIYNQSPLDFTFVQNNSILCNGDDATASLSITSNTSSSNLNYLWNTGDTTASIDSLVAGVYTLTLSDSTGNSIIKSDTITEPAPIVITHGGGATDVCYNTSNGAIFTNVQNGTLPYTYQWSTNATTSWIQNLSPGTYTLTVTDAVGCQDSVPFTIGALPLPNAYLGQDTSYCSVDWTGTHSINAPIAQPVPNTYLWSTGSTTSQITAHTPGNYSVTVTDQNGCVASDAFTLSINTNPTVSLGSDAGFCSNNWPSNYTIVPTGTNIHTYQWSDGSTNSTLTVNSDGNYSVTVSESNGCTASDQIVLNTFTPTQPFIGNDTLICEQDWSKNLTLQVYNAGFTNYSWSNSATSSSTTNLPSRNLHSNHNRHQWL